MKVVTLITRRRAIVIGREREVEARPRHPGMSTRDRARPPGGILDDPTIKPAAWRGFHCSGALRPRRIDDGMRRQPFRLLAA